MWKKALAHSLFLCFGTVPNERNSLNEPHETVKAFNLFNKYAPTPAQLNSS